MNQPTRFANLAAIAMVILTACSADFGSPAARTSVNQLVRFVETGDSTLLREVFTDSLLMLMPIEEMVATREDYVNKFGSLQMVDPPEFTTDSTVQVVLRYERTSLVVSLELSSQGAIRSVSIEPEPVKNFAMADSAAGLTDIDHLAQLRADFNADTDYVRLVTLLSPT